MMYVWLKQSTATLKFIVAILNHQNGTGNSFMILGLSLAIVWHSAEELVHCFARPFAALPYQAICGYDKVTVTQNVGFENSTHAACPIGPQRMPQST